MQKSGFCMTKPAFCFQGESKSVYKQRKIQYGTRNF